MSADAQQAYLLDGVRTPFGKYRGALAALDSLQLGQHVIREMIARHPSAARPDAALFGVVVQAGLGQNPARIATVRADVDPSTPALTLNSVCLASLEAVCDATRRIRGGEGSQYLVGGFDSMSRAARLAPGEFDPPDASWRSALQSDGLQCAISGLSMGDLSEQCNRELGITRQEQDEWAVMSQQRAARSAAFREESELLPVTSDGVVVTSDQGIRGDSSLAKLAALKPAFAEDGTITAANASQMSDGASAGIVVSGAMLAHAARQPLARIVDWAWVAGPDATLHLKPAAAIRLLLNKQNLRAADIDLYEINEAFASVAIASARDLGLSADVINVNGGAIAIGHPLGASGFRLLLTLALEMKRSGVKRGIASLCGGGGQGLAVLIDNTDCQ
ncbi:acetyl-CoA C-acetyltransferase [Paraburkholderia sp. BL6665CI2N2]|uniref:thiolase family protein n=1 Tax=Paraburkholderia sp. BL6665CI2N2 TaxID=1938806 RepID=UPI00106585E7|nr:thiolase family protein [Paraburkholderia sp. BL6665CI2N2]TDY15481.1 acetyl-CoA C-acetyltransferase [Paraburkholderia sp. BL6665CI2N2]